MNFAVYDISLLILFVIFVSVFLYRKRKNLKKEGLLFLYKTSWGIKLIDKIGNKYKKTLKILSYISIGLGYCLMTAMFYLLGKVVWIYVFHQNIVRMIKIPPIMPLVPYLPQIFKLDFLPPFYFIYWIIIIAVIAISHEFFHGIFAAYNKVKIKKTGFGFFPFFLPVFLAAFVELNEKRMAKKSKLKQMAILSAGTFANVLTGIFFFFVLWGFFALAFAPVGVEFDTYSYSVVAISNISSINNISLSNPSYAEIKKIVDNGLFEVKADNETYLITESFLSSQQNVEEYILLYDYTPAARAGIKGAITQIDNKKVNSREELAEELKRHSPGDEIYLKTKTTEDVFEYNIVLAENPDNENLPWLGIGFINSETGGLIGKITQILQIIKKPDTYYEGRFESALFIYNLLWWLVLISFSVALINMLPAGIFDGGRFLYLTVLGITKSEKVAKNIFKFLTYAILFIVFLLMLLWGISFIR